MQKKSIPHPKVLIVEDDPGHQRILELYLNRAGCTCKCCFDGKTALQIVDENPFDLIFIDIHIPEMDGIAVATRLREQSIKVPLIAVTAMTIESLKRNALKVGFNEFLQKPFSEGQIAKIVEQFP